MLARCMYDDDMKMFKFPGRHCAKSDDLIKLCGPESNDGRKESIYYEENIINIQISVQEKYPSYLLII